MALIDTVFRPVPTTTELLRDASNGDPAAWDQLVRRFENVVTSAVRSYRLQEADARDAAQRTWLQLLEHHQQLRDPEALPGWLARTAARECLRILRTRHHTTNLAEADALADPEGDTAQRVVDAVTAELLRELMGLLPLRARTLMYALFDDDPPGYAEIAIRTGIPIGSIGPTRARALRQLRGLIDQRSMGPGLISPGT